MRIVLVTQHFLAPNYRQAGVHHLVRALVRRGHTADFVTVAQGWLKQRLKARTRAFAAAATLAERDSRASRASVRGHVHRELIHPPSGPGWMNWLTVPVDRWYGRRLDPIFEHAARQADVLILECGYPLYYYEALRDRNRNATFVAFYMDRPDIVGFRPELARRYQLLLPKFDLVRTNSPRLMELLPPGTNGHYLPQGVDKASMRTDVPSPYPAGSRNIVSVGNMLFDEPAVRAIARAARAHGAQLHLIGARPYMVEPAPDVVLHEEMAFDRTLPFIVHADVGLAPYRLVDHADYLVQSSLKVQQFSYCGLPILIARGLAMRRENFVYYDPDDPEDIDRAVISALTMPRASRYGHDILDWDEVASGFEALLAGVRASTGRHA